MTSFWQVMIYIVGGVILLTVLTGILFLIYWILKKMGFFSLIKRLILRTQRKKLLKDEALLAFCYKRVEKGMTEDQVRTELYLSNKYKPGRIDAIVYVFNIIQKEIKGGEDKNAVSKGERGTKGEVAEDLPK